MSTHRTPTDPTRHPGRTRGGIRRTMAAVAVGAAALALAACGPETAITASQSSSAASTTTSSTTSTASSPMLSSLDLTSLDTHFDEDDLTWEVAEEQSITLADEGSSSDSDDVTVDDSTITITQAGVYRVSGSLTDGRLVVAAPDDQTVTIILDNASITSSTGPALSVTSADETMLYLEEGSSNTVQDGSDYEVADDVTPVAAIASASDLTIAGSGALSVIGTMNDGISSNDGLVIAGGDLTVTAADDALRGKDYVDITGGTFDITSGGDAIKSDNYEDEDRGWVLITAGTFTIDAGDDGIDAEQAIEMIDGTFTIEKSTEGLEAANVMIGGGTVDITASDDGINATAATTAEEAATAEEATAETTDARQQGPGGGGEEDDGSWLSISGGTVTIEADVDGLDSNGSTSLTGGTITITSADNGGDSPVDSNGEVTFDGVTLTANGTEIASADDLASEMGAGPGGGQMGTPPDRQQPDSSSSTGSTSDSTAT